MTTELELQHWSVILWDLDGTITDSGGEITQRISKALRIVGWPVPSLQELERLIGPPLYDGFIEVLGMPPEKAMETLTAQRTIAELQGLGRRSAVYSGIAPLLAELASDGIPMAVASSKGEHQVHSVLDHFDLSRYFLVRVGSDEAAGRTSKSLVIGEALRQLDETGVDLSRPVMVGDRVHDLEGAAEHGIPTAIVRWGYHNGERTDEALAHPRTAAQLRELLVSPTN
ncbi:MAG: HAD hydrolase-like protein [Leucobacter sp.]